METIQYLKIFRNIRDIGNFKYVEFSGSLDIQTLVELGDLLRDLQEHQLYNCILDISYVSRLSSYAMGLILDYTLEARLHDGQVLVLNTNSATQEEMEMLRVQGNIACCTDAGIIEEIVTENIAA